MRIGLFVYDFPHNKTEKGINTLINKGFKPTVIFAAPFKKLNFYQSKIRITPKDEYLIHPKEIARIHGIDYYSLEHNSQKVYDLVNNYNLDLGIIFGARILKPIAFKNFKLGVINLHPGILPENRGLDTIKWAIIKDLPQGVTSHFINSEIDKGKLILKKELKIYEDDTLLDLYVRNINLQMKLMIESLNIIKEKEQCYQILEEGSYHKSVPEDDEKTLHEKFKSYKIQNLY